VRRVEAHHSAVERVPSSPHLEPSRSEQPHRLLGDVHAVAGQPRGQQPVGGTAAGHGRHQGQRRWSAGHQRLALEVHPPAPRPPERGDLHRVAVPVRVGRAGEPEPRPGDAKAAREAAGHRVRDGAQRGRRAEERDVDQRLLLSQVQGCEEGVRGVAQLGDGHHRHHLGRGVERVVPAFAAKAPRPDREGVRWLEPIQVHRPQLTGIGAEGWNTVRTGNLGGRRREDEHAAVRKRSVARPPPLHSARAGTAGGRAHRAVAVHRGRRRRSPSWPIPLP
jgi:hypothetical protein